MTSEAIPETDAICTAASKVLYTVNLETGTTTSEIKPFLFTCDAAAVSGLKGVLLEKLPEAPKANADANGDGSKDDAGSSGLSAGAVAGIAIAVGVVCFLIGGVVVYFVAKPSE